MRHTITLGASSEIKNQRIHCKPIPNFHQDQIVKIQQHTNFLYAIYTPHHSQHTSTLSLTYIKLNHLEQQTLATMCTISQPVKSKYIEIQLSEMDYNLMNSNFAVLERGFLDQVNVIWPQARIPLYYNQSNWVVMMPKCNEVQLVDPYAAISFMVKVEGEQNKNVQEEQNQSQQEFEDKVMVLGRVDNQSKHKNPLMFGYDNVLYLSRQEFSYLKKFKSTKTSQPNNNANQLYCTIHPALPFLTSPTFEQFQQYKRLQAQKKLPELKPILVQLAAKQSIEEHGIGGEREQERHQKEQVDCSSESRQGEQVYFSCSQICKLSLGIPQQLILTEQSLLYNQSFETTTLDMFIKQLAEKNKYQVHLQLPQLYHLEQADLENIKKQFADSFAHVIKQKKEFVFLQNYYPFMVGGYVCGVVVGKMAASKRCFQPLKNFLIVKDISINPSTPYEQMKSLLQKSLHITQDLPAKKVSQWLPVIKQVQHYHEQKEDQKLLTNNDNWGNDDDLKFRTIFQTCYNHEILKCCQFLTEEVASLSPSSSKLLISTYSSNGKTYLHHYLTSTPTTSSQHLNYRSWYIDCRSLINPSNRIDDIKDYLDAVVTFCPYKILFFDNIDSMIPLIEEGDQMRQKEKIVSHVLGKYLGGLLEGNSKVAVFTAKSEANIDPRFKFDKIVKLKNPNRQLRADIVHSLKLNKPQSWLEQFIDKTESFSLGSLSHYIISSEIPIKKQSKRRNDFSKIVGLAKAKRAIISVIQKPNKFGFIYDKVRIKVPRGILLYGATGNGKTALGNAVEDQFPMKYFSVKGSDILSKYIGGSEAAVREIFEKALSVAPSIIFFDEFESIVPRRNSSGTGVTDRVVNQFLCYLDGVSSTTGVFIIAASSRPDLIDPALLRPGRIDSHIYLEYPTQSQRAQLLSLFNNSIKLEVADEQFINSTENYSYSDLIGLLKELRIKRSAEVLKEKERPQVEEFKWISKELFYDTVSTYRRGTDVEEQAKQNQIYTRFKEGKGPQIKKQKFIQM